MGNAEILDIIDAQRRNSQAQLGLARAKARRLADTARLYLALGGSSHDNKPGPGGVADEQGSRVAALAEVACSNLRASGINVLAPHLHVATGATSRPLPRHP